MQLYLNSLDDTHDMAAKIAALVSVGEAITLRGDLGAGKTTFARYVIRALAGAEVEVPSPSFTLVQTYDTLVFPLWHFDLYRLSKPEEALELAIEDAFIEAVSLIEWPEIIEEWLPEDRLDVHMAITPNGDGREMLLTAYGQWYNKLEKIISNLQATA